ncbi:ribonuclease HI family protein [Candidatus Uhrbacteria bacterium]|nr:ribonuclease HI family protein [Candidatus Uhrbacteria bacterium]
MFIRGTLYTDGGARGNPGPAGIGVVLRWTDDHGQHEQAYKEYIGATTNNVAEYRALCKGFALAKGKGATHVECFLDSELVVKQLNREYRVKDKELQALFLQVWNCASAFTRCVFRHIPREENSQADALVNEAIDDALKN